MTVTCRVLNVARAPYYRWRDQPVGEAERVRAHRMQALITAHREEPTDGYRILGNEARKAGWTMGRRTAWTLCNQQGITSAAQRQRCGSGKKPGPQVHDDLVQRLFTANAPNRLWLSDITEHRTAEGELYCCPIKDVGGNRIVGYSIGSRMTRHLVADAINNAVARRGDVAGCILHWDGGLNLFPSSSNAP